MKYIVYILYSKSRDKFYIGSASDELAIRIRKHNSNHQGFTGHTGDWIDVYLEEFFEKEFALRREMEIKKWKSRKMIMKLHVKPSDTIGFFCEIHCLYFIFKIKR